MTIQKIINTSRVFGAYQAEGGVWEFHWEQYPNPYATPYYDSWMPITKDEADYINACKNLLS